MRRMILALLAALALTVFTAVSASAVKPPKVEPGSNWVGWNWDRPVAVYDGTGNTRWDVAGAAAAWAKFGPDFYMTTDASAADVTVTQGDANAMCGTNASIIGCTETTRVAGEPHHTTIIMSEAWADWTYTVTLEAGTLHEFCHASGFTHPAGLTNDDSACGVPIPSGPGGPGGVDPRTSLSNFDRAGLRLAY